MSAPPFIETFIKTAEEKTIDIDMENLSISIEHGLAQIRFKIGRQLFEARDLGIDKHNKNKRLVWFEEIIGRQTTSSTTIANAFKEAFGK